MGQKTTRKLINSQSYGITMKKNLKISILRTSQEFLFQTRVAICLVLFCLFCSAYAEDKIPIIYFYEVDCPNCKMINDQVLPLIIEKYGRQIHFFKRNVAEMQNFEAMMAFETKYLLKPHDVPEFYTSFGVTYALDKISKELPDLINKQLHSKKKGRYAGFIKNYLETGKTGISVLESIKQQYGDNNDSDKPGDGAKEKLSGKLLIYEFYKTGCRTCSRLNLSLRYLKNKFPKQIIIKTFNIKDSKSKILNEAYCIKYKVNEKLHLATPALFFGNQAIAGEKAFDKLNLVSLVIDNLQNLDKVNTQTLSDSDMKNAEKAIYKRFEAISWTAVLGAGLLDGINPCAFVTIIFLLSYLTVMKYSKKDIAFVGLSFTLAVFLTYLAIGLGFLQFVSFLQNVSYINDIIYYIAIAFAAIVGLLNIWDYYKIKKGSLADINLKLSDSLRKRINAVIRNNVKLRHYIIGAFGMGFAVSLLELTCTGQVYLPTVLFIINTQGMEFKAVVLLVAYNLAFIIPLIIIFILFWQGSSEKRISQWLTRHGAKIKLAMGLLFLLLAAILFFVK